MNDAIPQKPFVISRRHTVDLVNHVASLFRHRKQRNRISDLSGKVLASGGFATPFSRLTCSALSRKCRRRIVSVAFWAHLIFRMTKKKGETMKMDDSILLFCYSFALFSILIFNSFAHSSMERRIATYV